MTFGPIRYAKLLIVRHVLLTHIAIVPAPFVKRIAYYGRGLRVEAVARHVVHELEANAVVREGGGQRGTETVTRGTETVTL